MSKHIKFLTWVSKMTKRGQQEYWHMLCYSNFLIISLGPRKKEKRALVQISNYSAYGSFFSSEMCNFSCYGVDTGLEYF